VQKKGEVKVREGKEMHLCSAIKGIVSWWASLTDGGIEMVPRVVAHRVVVPRVVVHRVGVPRQNQRATTKGKHGKH